MGESSDSEFGQGANSLHDDPPKPDPIAAPPIAPQPLDYGRPNYEPRRWVVLPLLGGVIVGISNTGCLGVFWMHLVSMGSDRGIAIGFPVIFALLLVVRAAQQARSRRRDWFHWFILGLLLGLATTILIGVVTVMSAR